MPDKIIKRDGREVAFNPEKITDAILRAFRASNIDKPREFGDALTAQVVSELNAEDSDRTPSVEEVQDIVERVLIENGFAHTAKSYILYRAERSRIREMNTRLMRIYDDITRKSAVDSDVKRENANINGDTAMGAMLKYCMETLGYEIENRTWNDGLLYKMSDSDMASEIFSADNAVDRALAANYGMRFFRMHGGYGVNDVRTHAYLRSLGYQGVVNWTYDAAVCSNDRLRNTLAPGNIYLFHTTAEDVVKLRNLLAYAQEHEYRFVTVSTLLGLEPNSYEAADPQSLLQAAPAAISTSDIYIETRSGDRTWQVYLIQRQLAALGYLDASPDGIFGDSTAAAIRSFQADHGVVTSGIATTETQQALFSEESMANAF